MTKDVEVTERDSFSGKDYQDPPPAPLIDAEELSRWSFYRALFAQFIATMLFLYLTLLTMMGTEFNHKSDTKAGDLCGGVGILGITWAFGGFIFILVFCTAGISGSHINSAVTCGLVLACKLSLVRAILGAISGVGLVKAFQKVYFNDYGGGANSLGSGYCTVTGLDAEIIGTFVWVYCVFSATDPKRNARDSQVPACSQSFCGLVLIGCTDRLVRP